MKTKRNLLLSFSAEPAKQLDKAGLVFEKEIVRAGQFTKPGKNGKPIVHVITEEDVKYWPKVFSEMKADGVTVPIPLEHTVDPEKRRATITDMVHRPNSKGIPAAFARIEFRDHEAAKLAKTAGVSVYVPHEIHNGTKNKTYRRAIEHVALTDYPVINDLEPFKPLALSLHSPEEDEDVLTLRELATQMGVDPSITDEQQILLAMSQKITAMRGPGAGAPGGGPPAPAPMGPPRPPGPPRPFGMSQNDDGDDEPIALSGTLLTMAVENRENKVERLVEKRLITPVVAKSLKEQYATKDALAFSHVEGFNDGFDGVYAALLQNSPVIPDGKKAPHQAMALSRDENGVSQNALVRDAERKAEAAKKGYAGSYS